METLDHNRKAGRKHQTRRDFFHLVSDGIYGTALTYLLCQDLYGGTEKLRAESEFRNRAWPPEGVRSEGAPYPVRAKSQGGHPALDEWRTQPDGFV
jgi:hypothetical protein